MSAIRTLASTENPLFSPASMSAAAPASRSRCMRNQRTTRRRTFSVVTAWLNGKLVQDGLELTEPRSPYISYKHGATDFLRGIEKILISTGKGPLFLQDHGSPTRFRNVWIRPF
jgi:hypothetical protein